MFEAFFTTRATFGTGIGLFVAKQFVEGHGGQSVSRAILNRRDTERWFGFSYRLILSTKLRMRPERGVGRDPLRGWEKEREDGAALAGSRVLLVAIAPLCF